MAVNANRTTDWQEKMTGQRKYCSVETSVVDTGVNKMHGNRYEEQMKLGIAYAEKSSGNNSMAVSLQEETKNSTKLSVQEKGKQIKTDILGKIKDSNAKKRNGKPTFDCAVHQTERETWNDAVIKQNQSLRNIDQGLEASKRTSAIHLEILPRSSKRLRKTTKLLIVEEPRPPPLKLPKLHIVLKRNEILEDWFKITGKKYNGKPKKSSIVQLGLGLCTSLTCPSSIRYLKDH